MIRNSFLLVLLTVCVGLPARAAEPAKKPEPVPAFSATPLITVSGTLLSEAIYYGTPAAADSLLVSGTALTSGITITSPSGFEVSTNSLTGYAGNLLIGSAGNSITKVYIRLAALTPASATSYTGNLTLSSPGAITVNSPSISGTVNPKQLALILSDDAKSYGDSMGSYVATANIPTGANGEVITGAQVTPDAVGSSPKSPAGSSYVEVLSNATGPGAFKLSNYLIYYHNYTGVILPAPLAVLASKETKTYGTTLNGGNGSVQFTAPGLQNGETIGSVTASFAAGYHATDPVKAYPGSITITGATSGSFSPSNYTITYTGASLIVTPAPLVITGDSITKVYGTALSTQLNSNAFTQTGLANGETLNTVTITYVKGSAATDAVGRYPASTLPGAASGGSFNFANYTITYQGGDLVVGRHALTVTPNSVNKPYGAALTGVAASTAFTITGLQNSETATTASLAYGPGASAADSPGTYPASVSGSNLSGGSFLSSNYTLTYLPSALIVGTPTPSFTVLTQPDCNTANGSFAIQNYNPAYTYTVSSPGFIAQSGADFILPAGTYTITALAPGSFTSPVSLSFAINPQPSLPVLIITNPAQVHAPAVINLQAPAITGLSDPGLVFSYFSDVNGTRPLDNPAAVSVSGTYYIRAKGAAGCASVMKAVYVEISPVTKPVTPVIFIPNIFTPNGDGKNDRFEITGIQAFPGSSLQIFNRWGNLLFRAADYANTWDGAGQMAGTYYYVLKLNRGGGASTEYKGWVQLIR